MNTVSFVVLLLLSVGFGGSYTLLGLKAHGHLTAEASKMDRQIGWLFWWSFDKDKYDAEGKRICKKGDLIFFPLIACYIAWYVLILK